MLRCNCRQHPEDDIKDGDALADAGVRCTSGEPGHSPTLPQSIPCPLVSRSPALGRTPPRPLDPVQTAQMLMSLYIAIQLRPSTAKEPRQEALP